MEKRTFLAIILSILILYAYQGVFIKKQPLSKPLVSSTQVIENKAFIEQQTKENSSTAENQASSAENKEEIFDFETTSLLFKFSNIGGTLKSVTIKKYNETLPLESIFDIPEYKSLDFNLETFDNNQIVYTLKQKDQEIKKIYDLSRQDYQFNLSVEIKNLSEMSKIKNIEINPLIINTEETIKDKSLSREKSLYEYSVSLDGVTTRNSNAFKFSSKNDIHKMGTVKWVAFRNRYFCAIINPEFITKDYKAVAESENIFKTSFESDSVTIDPGKTVKFSALAYFGPQNIETMKAYGKGFEDVVVFSRFQLMDFISKIIIKIMNFTYKIIPSWGLAIILVSLIVYGAMYPLTINGMLSMKKMQSLQPEIARIREDNKNNPKKMNQDVMELYKKNSVNPLGGCLPFILQMPVFIALYQALWRSVMFKGESFLWIKDLAEPDRLFIFPVNLPVIGNEFNILPILMMIIMFFQQKFSSKNMVATDPNQIMQQKMMAIFFPIMLGFIFYKFASGLCLYFTMFYLLSTLSQWKMSKVTKEL